MNLRDAAKGRPCMLRLDGCAPGPENETVVLAHRRGGGVKSADTDATLACYNCHLRLDGAESLLPETYDQIFEPAKARTLAYWKREGVLSQGE